jgi:hypothetical protein
LLTDIVSVGEVNEEGLRLDKIVNTRLSRLCSITVWQRVPLTLQGFNESTKNEKDEPFKNPIQAYAQYPKELKKNGKKVGMKTISHFWRTYKSKLVKIWRDQDTRSISSKIWQKKTGQDMLNGMNWSSSAPIVSTYNGSNHRMSLTTTSATPVMLENRESDKKRMKDCPSRVLRIHMINSVDGWDHLFVLFLS